MQSLELRCSGARANAMVPVLLQAACQAKDADSKYYTLKLTPALPAYGRCPDSVGTFMGQILVSGQRLHKVFTCNRNLNANWQPAPSALMRLTAFANNLWWRAKLA